MHLPTEDKNYVTKNDMYESIRVLLGGRAAEQLVLGDISTGAVSYTHLDVYKRQGHIRKVYL